MAIVLIYKLLVKHHDEKVDSRKWYVYICSISGFMWWFLSMLYLFLHVVKWMSLAVVLVVAVHQASMKLWLEIFPSWYRSNTDVLGRLSFLIKFHCSMIWTTLSETKRISTWNFPVVTKHVWSTNICGKTCNFLFHRGSESCRRASQRTSKRSHRKCTWRHPFLGVSGRSCFMLFRHTVPDMFLPKNLWSKVDTFRSHFWNVCFLLDLMYLGSSQRAWRWIVHKYLYKKNWIRHIWEMESLILQALKDQIAKFYCVYYTYMCRITVV